MPIDGRKYLWRIKRLEIKSWLKYLMIQRKSVVDYVLGELTTGTDITINNTVEKKFYKFDIKGNSTQDGTPAPDNEVPILSAGDEYTELEYIESTGTQYIDTGYVINTNCSAKYGFMITGAVSNGHAIAGIYDKENDLYFGIVRSANSKLSYRYKNTFYVSNTTIVKDTLYDVETSLKKSNQFLKINNIEEIHSSVSSDVTNNLTSFIFRINGLSAYYMIGRIYYFKIYDNDVLVRDFIPCKRNSDNEVGLYDLVNNVFHTNAGTGTFIAGTEKSGFIGNNGSISEKIVNKNLFDITEYPFYSGIAYNEGQLVYCSGYQAITKYFPVLPNTQYTFSNDLNKPIYYGLVYYDKGKNVLSYTSAGTRTFTTPNNCAFIRFAIQSATAPTEVQIEYGSTATTYTAHQEQTYTILVQQPMRSIGTVRDSFVKVNGEWKERHNIGYISSYNGETISTEYMSTTGGLDTGASVQYVLETPNDLTCTSEQIVILENLPKSYNEQTNIYSIDTTPAYLEVQAYVKKEEVLEND